MHEHDLIIFGKCLCDKNFVANVARELIAVYQLLVKITLTSIVSRFPDIFGIGKSSLLLHGTTRNFMYKILPARNKIISICVYIAH